MTKDEYMSLDHVIGFVDYFRSLVLNSENSNFYHRFNISNSNGVWGASWRRYNGGNGCWEVSSLQEACEKYYWPYTGHVNPGYEDNARNLHEVSQYVNGRKCYSNVEDYTELFAKFLEHKNCSASDQSLPTINKVLKEYKNALGGDVREYEQLFSAANMRELRALPFEPTGEESQLIGGLDALAWGGVLKGRASSGWLYREYGEHRLNNSLSTAVELLTGETESTVTASFKGSVPEYRMNAGMTKVYSLYSGKSIIYDGRVGAALGVLVGKYLRSQGVGSIPKALKFLWGADLGGAAEGCLNRRDPSSESYQFPKLSNQSHTHALMNLRANWIFEAVIPDDEEMWGATTRADRFRALEAALFMIGYDVSAVR